MKNMRKYLLTCKGHIASPYKCQWREGPWASKQDAMRRAARHNEDFKGHDAEVWSAKRIMGPKNGTERSS